MCLISMLRFIEILFMDLGAMHIKLQSIYKFHISSHFEKFSKHERNGWNMVKALRHDQSRNR